MPLFVCAYTEWGFLFLIEPVNVVLLQFNFLEKSVYICLENHSRIIMHLSVQIIDFAITYNTVGSH